MQLIPDRHLGKECRRINAVAEFPQSVIFKLLPSASAWQALSVSSEDLTKLFDDYSGSVAADARLFGGFACRLVGFLASPSAFRADVLPGSGRARLRIIIGGVLSEWISGLHKLSSMLP